MLPRLVENASKRDGHYLLKALEKQMVPRSESLRYAVDALEGAIAKGEEHSKWDWIRKLSSAPESKLARAAANLDPENLTGASIEALRMAIREP